MSWRTRSHAGLGPCDHHHAQGNAFVKVPLLYGGSQTDDPHQQQGGVFTVLSCHLNITQRRIFDQDQLLKRASASF